MLLSCIRPVADFRSTAGVISGLKWTLGLQILKEDDSNWPEADRVGCQELEVLMGKEHICFRTTKIGSLVDVQNSNDPEGLKVFYYLVQDLKCMIFSLISLHFKIKPI